MTGSDDDDSGDSRGESPPPGFLPGNPFQPPVGKPWLDPCEDYRDYTRLIQTKAICQDVSRLFTGFSEFARHLWPADYAVMTGPEGLLVPSFRRDPIEMEHLKEYVFAELLHLQGALGIERKGEYFLPIITFPFFFFRTNEKMFSTLARRKVKYM